MNSPKPPLNTPLHTELLANGKFKPSTLESFRAKLKERAAELKNRGFRW